jgi:hypothetical protein
MVIQTSTAYPLAKQVAIRAPKWRGSHNDHRQKRNPNCCNYEQQEEEQRVVKQRREEFVDPSGKILQQQLVHEVYAVHIAAKVDE